MSLFRVAERKFLEAVAQLAYGNPFLPERIEYEKAVLGPDFQPGEPVWSLSVVNPDRPRENEARVHAKLDPLMNTLRERLRKDADCRSDERDLYEDCIQLLLYQRFYLKFVSANGDWGFYRQFLADWNYFFHLPGKQLESSLDSAHIFACFRQIQRAFHYIFDNIIGSSLPAARLRASIWQSIFTHDMGRYRRTMYRRMAEFPTLITGPSGTGKELVARAIAGSRYVPFGADRLKFEDAAGDSFVPINIAALSPTLVESELFGHRRGAFTGAIADRKGWLESCPSVGSVFLDELGEMDLGIQVKLLRVLETRRFSPVGNTSTREFQGKLIAATNRNLPLEVKEKRFREDLYYRLCADLIETPSLADQLHSDPEVLPGLLHYMTRRVVGEEIERCLPEVENWIREQLPADYDWPGNYRELEQCVRNIIIRGSYRPIAERSGSSRGDDTFAEDFRAGRLTASELLAYYAARIYQQTGSYEESARRLRLDRRTVKAKVSEYLSK